MALDGALAVSVRRATRNDVQAIVALLADDRLGAAREDAADLSGYLAAFERITTTRHTCWWWPTTAARWSGRCSSA